MNPSEERVGDGVKKLKDRGALNLAVLKV